MTYNEIVGIILFAPIVATLIGLGAIWVCFKLDESTFRDETDD